MDAKFFVPFETAQLLRKKGYPQDKSDYGYFDNGDSHPLIMFPADNFDCAASTYHEVVDWLYEKKICITCNPAYSYEGQYNGFQYEMQTYDDDDYQDDIYRTREEALNAGILAALEML